MAVKWKDVFKDREKLLAFLKKNKLILLIGLVGLVLLLIPVGSGGNDTPVIAETETETFSVGAFEKKLEDILSDVKGAGSVRVMLSLKNGTESVYATNDSTSLKTHGSETSQSSDRTVVMQSQGGVSAPVEEKRIYPRFSGAVVVCDGAGKSSVELMIIRAVASVTGLTTDKISVLPRK